MRNEKYWASRRERGIAGILADVPCNGQALALKTAILSLVDTVDISGHRYTPTLHFVKTPIHSLLESFRAFVPDHVVSPQEQSRSKLYDMLLSCSKNL